MQDSYTPGGFTDGQRPDMPVLGDDAAQMMVWTLFNRGVRVPAHILIESAPVFGLVSLRRCQHGVPGNDKVHVFDLDGKTVLRTLHDAKLRRDENGCRVYQGHVGGLSQFSGYQRWLCAPTAAKGMEIIQRMVYREAYGRDHPLPA